MAQIDKYLKKFYKGRESGDFLTAKFFHESPSPGSDNSLGALLTSSKFLEDIHNSRCTTVVNDIAVPQ
jgi:hypothetical protein